MVNSISSQCELYDRICISCGECDICDLDPKKKCDNCSRCLEDTGEFRILKVNDFIKDNPKKIYKLKK